MNQRRPWLALPFVLATTAVAEELKIAPSLGRANEWANEDIARRLEHMRIAVDHLHQAGLYDVAEHVTQRAEAAGARWRCDARDHETTRRITV